LGDLSEPLLSGRGRGTISLRISKKRGKKREEIAGKKAQLGKETRGNGGAKKKFFPLNKLPLGSGIYYRQMAREVKLSILSAMRGGASLSRGLTL